jgi:hypothetical protein
MLYPHLHAAASEASEPRSAKGLAVAVILADNQGQLSMSAIIMQLDHESHHLHGEYLMSCLVIRKHT